MLTLVTAAPAGPRDAAAPRELAGWLDHAEALHEAVIDLGLARVARVHAALGLALDAAVVTVAGTNGKGSTCALLEALLRAAGHRVGVYTSPHLVRWAERVRIDGVPVGEALLAAAFARVEEARGDVPLTAFEFGTLAALVLFAEAGLDAVVLEVGLGGRLDAVNVVDPDVAVVTSIGIDHVEYLGPTRESIGREKAGIFRAGRPAVCADPDPPASIAAVARERGARLAQHGVDWRIESDAAGGCWTLIERGGRRRTLPRPALAGEAQLHNAAAALLALDALADRLPVGAAERDRALRSVWLAGRFQRLRHAPSGAEVVLDVAHNPHAAERLAATLAAEPAAGRCLAVLGMLRDKDVAGTLAALGGAVDHWFLAGLGHARRGASAAELAAAFDAAGVARPAERCASPRDALRRALAAAAPGDRVLVCGSFVTVGEALQAIEARRGEFAA